MKNKKADVNYCGVSRKKILKATPELDWINVAHFRDFVIDRYRIHKRKDIAQLEPPWTNNEVLREFKFTNVRREHDRQTRYLIDHIVNNHELTIEDKIVNCFMFRAWNNCDTFEKFGLPLPAEQIYTSELKELVRSESYMRTPDRDTRRWWSNAYNQGGTKAAWKYPTGRLEKGSHLEKEIPLRPFHIGPWLKDQRIVEQLLGASDQKECFEAIQTVRGFAQFLAYQVFVDLTYIREFPFSENEFTIAGPGCKRGIDLIFKDKDGLTYEECIFWLRDRINDTSEDVNKNLFLCEEINETKKRPWEPESLFYDLAESDRVMNVMSIENCMCELSKYVKAKNGTGRPKNRYRNEGGTQNE